MTKTQWVIQKGKTRENEGGTFRLLYFLIIFWLIEKLIF